MSAIVVDTDVISLIFKSHSLSGPYLDALDGGQLVMSFMTLAELKLWAKRRTWGEERIEGLRLFLENFSVCQTDELLCDVWASIREDAFRRGLQINVADAWVAATAIYLNAPLATNNTRHFQNVSGLTIVSFS